MVVYLSLRALCFFFVLGLFVVFILDFGTSSWRECGGMAIFKSMLLLCGGILLVNWTECDIKRSVTLHFSL
jgi:hypothetical protein